jgi:glutathione synthase/RimK-type ligase-like ATP-grasp enzyme
MYNLNIRSRHPSHDYLRRNSELSFDSRVVYRLGSKTSSIIKNEINSIESVLNSSDKFKMKKMFLDAEIPSTKFFFLDNVLEGLKFPVLAKKRFGSKGKGMLKFNSKKALDEFLLSSPTGYYLEEYFSGSREYRLHVSELGCFYACRKLRKEDAKERWFFNSLNCVWVTEKEQELNPDDNTFVQFTDVDKELFNKPLNWEEITLKAVEAIKSIGLHIGAVDVRVNKLGDFVILETNSAPSFGELTKLMYLKHLKKLINFKFYT